MLVRRLVRHTPVVRVDDKDDRRRVHKIRPVEVCECSRLARKATQIPDHELDLLVHDPLKRRDRRRVLNCAQLEAVEEGCLAGAVEADHYDSLPLGAQLANLAA
tara:strand:+ start:281 stop:592 length:312 start_codon:yes stop_codon:yes gene_type:complete